MDNFLLSDMFSPSKLKAKLNSLITWAQSTFAALVHTHTTNDVKDPTDQTKTLTADLTELWKYAKKNRKLAKAAM